eukprot:scaffold251243_cov43-Attheya_sp.AAC.2
MAVNEQEAMPMRERWNHAIGMVETAPVEAVTELSALQTTLAEQVSRNETLDDIATGTLSLLADYHDLLDQEDEEQEASTGTYSGRGRRTEGQARESKMKRHKMKQEAQQDVKRLQALRERSARFSGSEGFDDEDSLDRSAVLAGLKAWAVEALEELYSAPLELQMLDMHIERQDRQRLEGGLPTDHVTGERDERRKRELSGKSLELTHITQNGTTGALQFRKEELQSQVFRPGWNQPTMTLQELGDREVADARAREENQKVAEAEALHQPRRYDQLVRDGMEDNADLADASAALDRKWDQFKDENPRGSGNKMKDVGDRNF